MVKAVVACGGGIATSTYVEQEILEIARKNGKRKGKRCKRIGRNLNDTRGLFHSFRDSYEVMKNLFADLSDADVCRQ